LTTVATDSHATSRIGDAELKDIPSRADSSSSPDPIHDINHGFSDSDLTEIDDDEEPVVPDATPGSLGDSAGGGIIEAGNTFNSATEMNHHSAHRPRPTRRQSLLCEEHDSSDGEGHSCSTSAPAKTVNNTRCSSQLRASKQKETRTRRKGDQANHDSSVERRSSSRQRTATKEIISSPNISNEDKDDRYHGTVVRPRRNTGKQDAILMVEMTSKDDPDPDAWKAGWSKSSNWAKVLPEKEFAIDDTPVTKRKHLPTRNRLPSQRPVNGAHQGSHGILRKSRRVPCPKGCGKTFGRAHDAHRHANLTEGCGGGQKIFICDTCSSGFSRKDALRRHQGQTDDATRPVAKRCSTPSQGKELSVLFLTPKASV
jgi:hypothetical protein